jgi:uncharacterized protein (DUF3084 family)
MAVVSGVVISALTVFALTLISDDAHMALFELEVMSERLELLTRATQSQSVELANAQRQLTERADELSRLNAEHGKANVRLTELDQAGRKAQSELSALKLENDKAQAARDQLQAEVKKLETEARRLEAGIVNLREGQVTFRARQVIYSGVIRGGQDEAATVKTLSDFLAFANQYVVEILQLENKDTQVLFLTQSSLANTIAYLMNGDGPMAVRLQAAGNIIMGEPVLVEFAIYPNKLIYPARRVIYAQTVPARTDKQAMQELLIKFLAQLNQKAVGDGLLPDPLTGNVGNLPLPYIMETVNKMHSFSGAFILAAVARDDIYALGPLLVDIELRNFP